MKASNTLLTIFFLAIALFAAAQATSPIPELSTEVQHIVEKMAEYNVLEGESGPAGIASTGPTAQWHRYERLNAIATHDELLALTQHINAVVRCYAFETLAARKDTSVFRILIKHLNDRALVIEPSGCEELSTEVREFMYGLVNPLNHHIGFYTLTPQEQKTSDSMFLYIEQMHADIKKQLRPKKHK